MYKNSTSSHFEQTTLNIVGVSSKPVKSETGLLVKSPLRYPGGKSRAVKYILDLIPQGIDTLASPFLGGGSIELAMASKRGTRVYGYDIFKPLVTFWQALLKNPSKLSNAVKEHHPLSRTKFYALQNRFPNIKTNNEIATAFFVLNRSSYSGTTLSGGMSLEHPRFTQSAIDRLSAFNIDNFTVDKADFSKSIPKHGNDFLYLDPPYANGGALYGNRGDCHVDFNHEKLANLLGNRDGWLLSYNDCTKVRDLYKGHEIIIPEWTYGMSNDKASKEVLVLSRDWTRMS